MLLIGALLGGLIGLGSIANRRYDLGPVVILLLFPFSIPGLLVAVFLGMFAILGPGHDPNMIVAAVIDLIFYAWLFDFVMNRRHRRAR